MSLAIDSCPNCGWNIATYSVAAAAKFLGVTREWLGREARAGRVFFYLDDGGRRRYPLAELEKIRTKRAQQTFRNGKPVP